MITEISENFKLTKDDTCPNCGGDTFEMIGAKIVLSIRRNNIQRFNYELHGLIPEVVTCVLCGKSLEKIRQ